VGDSVALPLITTTFSSNAVSRPLASLTRISRFESCAHNFAAKVNDTTSKKGTSDRSHPILRRSFMDVVPEGEGKLIAI
jgi:hypothetical protein